MAKIRTDQEIHRAILQELKWDPHVEETEVGVEVDNGVVTLTGTVNSYAKRIAAQDAAYRVAGVLDLANDIEVLLPTHLTRTDAEIAQAVRHVLEADVFIPHDQIRSVISNGWITLEGRVPYWGDRHWVENSLHKVVGVRGITNNLAVCAPPAEVPELKHIIEQALERRAEREARRIVVQVREGKVSLTGKVHNWNEKRAVLGAVGYAPGVTEVEDNLQVEPFF